jgi:hypothetical protein
MSAAPSYTRISIEWGDFVEIIRAAMQTFMILELVLMQQ